ncbi:hypothetical protein JOF56_009372 [Kibdelosporangium banguiense]|uniref:1,4-beta-xylanase n=1 Tax=Kibdelosporangium banguiense TaxID=1365924 RepID=A0ABS4TX81_9PSEU|nr:family 43 glycosylhydrolase [Kibdelosporangium banguiense]MBP2328987.1 hypothetical protein [Kibdelosporangium banguiense]
MNRVICNPLDLAYRYQDIRPMRDPRTVHREAADPSVVLYAGRYYMFASMARGFWHSLDLVTWEYQPTEKLPPLGYAPDAREINGALYLSASRRGVVCPFFRSTNPLADDFEEVTPGTFDFWDPHLFQDKDGTTYFYWGCDNRTPIRGTEIDPVTFERVGETADLFGSDIAAHGWERSGENHVLQPPRTEREKLIRQYIGTDPFIEGAWMNRHGDTYYLQYAAPATELNTYADGYYTAESPLGPFTYSPNSPFSYKPGGFITGAGHGSTFQDRHGNWWHASTMRISVNHNFERRIGLFPAGFDEDGVLFCNQNFADYPTSVPDRAFDPWKEAAPQWMLVSYRAHATSSSSVDGHSAGLAVDEDVRTWWAAGTNAPGEWLQIDLGAPKTVHAIQVNLADHHLADRAAADADAVQLEWEVRGIFRENEPAELLVEASTDGHTWTTVHDGRDTGRDTPHLFVTLDRPLSLRHVRVTVGRLPFGGQFAVSGLRVFGRGTGSAPGVTAPHATRVDERTAHIEWEPVPGVQGYNVRFGLTRDKLYHSWLLYEQTDLDLRALNAGTDCWIAVDAFNENGVTAGTPTLAAR